MNNTSTLGGLISEIEVRKLGKFLKLTQLYLSEKSCGSGVRRLSFCIKEGLYSVFIHAKFQVWHLAPS